MPVQNRRTQIPLILESSSPFGDDPLVSWPPVGPVDAVFGLSPVWSFAAEGNTVSSVTLDPSATSDERLNSDGVAEPLPTLSAADPISLPSDAPTAQPGRVPAASSTFMSTLSFSGCVPLSELGRTDPGLEIHQPVAPNAPRRVGPGRWERGRDAGPGTSHRGIPGTGPALA